MYPNVYTFYLCIFVWNLYGIIESKRSQQVGSQKPALVKRDTQLSFFRQLNDNHSYLYHGMNKAIYFSLDDRKHWRDQLT